MQRDAVCGKDLRHEPYVFSVEHRGERYSFCSLPCRRAFEAQPEQYARPALARAFGRFLAFLRSEDREGGGTCC